MNRGLSYLLVIVLFCGISYSQNCPSTPCAAGLCCSKWGYCGTGTEYCGSGSSSSSSSGSSSSGSSTGSCKLSNIFSQADFNKLFPRANHGKKTNQANQYGIFNYNNLIAAANYFPKFACEGTVEIRKREVAAFLAQTSQETSGWWAGQPYDWGFVFSTEVGCTATSCRYCESSSTNPCASGKGYYGRGPLQLTWNYNYGQVSRAIFGDNRLLNDPDMLLRDATLAFRTSLWFWMTTQSPKPSCHNVITGIWKPSTADTNVGRRGGSFGMTTNIINGGLECYRATPQSVTNRVKYPLLFLI